MNRITASQRTRNQRMVLQHERWLRATAELEGIVNGTPYLPTPAISR